MSINKYLPHRSLPTLSCLVCHGHVPTSIFHRRFLVDSMLPRSTGVFWPYCEKEVLDILLSFPPWVPRVCQKITGRRQDGTSGDRAQGLSRTHQRQDGGRMDTTYADHGKHRVRRTERPTMEGADRTQAGSRGAGRQELPEASRRRRGRESEDQEHTGHKPSHSTLGKYW